MGHTFKLWSRRKFTDYKIVLRYILTLRESIGQKKEKKKEPTTIDFGSSNIFFYDI